MGAVGRPEDLVRGRRRLVEKGLQDLSPGLRNSVVEVLQAWEGERSEEKLTDLIGKEKTRRLLESFRPE